MKSIVHLLILLVVAPCAFAGGPKTTQTAALTAPREESTEFSSEESEVRGWDHLVGKLKERGVPPEVLQSIYTSTLMPEFTPVTFRLKPKESPNIYRGFRDPNRTADGRAFLEKHHATFKKAESTYQVPASVIASIMLVETHFGENTGTETIINRLSRVGSVGDPENLKFNLKRLREEDPSVTMEQLEERVRYLEETFIPEITALIEISRKNRINIFNIKGSIAGAFGIPQFLPSNYLRFGVDGNHDGIISLFNIPDSIFSIGNYLHSVGWNAKSTKAEQHAVIWHYNHSEPYVETILWLAEALKKPARNGLPKRRTNGIQ